VEAIFDSVPHFRGHTQEIVHMTRNLRGDTYRFAWVPSTQQEGQSCRATKDINGHVTGRFVVVEVLHRLLLGSLRIFPAMFACQTFPLTSIAVSHRADFHAGADDRSTANPNIGPDFDGLAYSCFRRSSAFIGCVAV